MTLVIAAALCSASAGDAKENYDKACAKCHGKEGKGDTKMGQKLGIKDYSDAKVQADLKDDAAFKAIKDGVKDKEGKVVFEIPLTFGVVGALIAPQLAAIGAIAALLTEATVVVEKVEN